MPTEQTKVLFVCTGNICRSPVAERMLQQRSVEQGLNLLVSSAGTRALNGKPMHPESVRVLRNRSVDPEGFSSRMLTPRLVFESDLVLGLTRDHRAAARQLAPVRWRSVHALREIANGGTCSGIPITGGADPKRPVNPADPELDIDDPIGRSADVFDRVAEEIEATMSGLVAWIGRQLVVHNTVQQVAK